jgi:putative DNA primase/helicase
MSPAEIWPRLELATDAHAYLAAKQGVPDGLRVVPAGDPLRIAGQSVAGWLAVPMLGLDGTLHSLQFIPPPGAGKKLNLPGCPVQGMFTVGEITSGGTIYVCEGIGQAWAAWKATGRAAVCCFGWGRVRAVATELRRYDPVARLVLVPDVGKEDEAQAIALEVGAAVAYMPAGEPDNFDAADYGLREGFDVLADLLESAKEPAKPEPRYKLLTAAEMVAQPPHPHIIKRTIPAGSVGAFVGATGSAKSFLVLHALNAIAEGEPWFELRTMPRVVLYIGLEGAAGIANRVRALRATGHDCENLRFMVTALDIRDKDDRSDLIETIRASGTNPAVIAIDTLARSSPGADENSGQDMGQIIAALSEVQHQLGATVIAVHHTGKDSTKGPRGHSSLLAALDFAIEVRRDGDVREWQLIKAKDAADGEIHPFSLRVVGLGEDEDGDEITSCVVHELDADDTPQQRRPVAPSGGNQRLAWLAVTDLIKASQEFGKGAAPTMRKCITLEAAIEATCQRLACEPKRRRERATTAITGLASRGCIGLQEEVIWLI